MAIETTLAIIKPDAIEAGHAGKILALLEEKGFRIRGLKLMRLSAAQAREFYAVHRERPFFGSLVEFMTSAAALPVALERDNAQAVLREVMGATDSTEAAPGTVRALYGTDIERNAIHGSDSPETAAQELAFFFSEAELLGAR